MISATQPGVNRKPTPLEPVIQKKKKTQVIETESSDSEYKVETKAKTEEEKMAAIDDSEEEEIVKKKVPIQSKQTKATSISDSESEESNDNDSYKDDELLKKKEIAKGKKPLLPTEQKSSSEETEVGEEVSESEDDVKEVFVPKTWEKASVSVAEKKGKFRAISIWAILPGKIMNAQWLERNRLG
ncbi:hypothetical protein Droror1_Dr00026623 [Drosera rotundifolia]